MLVTGGVSLRIIVDGARRSLPQISFVIFDSMTLQELDELFLKRTPSMMLGLIRDICFDAAGVLIADGERSVAGLPCE